MLDTVTTCNYTSFDIMINVRHTLIWVFGVQILIGLIYVYIYIYILKCNLFIARCSFVLFVSVEPCLVCSAAEMVHARLGSPATQSRPAEAYRAAGRVPSDDPCRKYMESPSLVDHVP